MNAHDQVTSQQLNAYLDNELEQNERAQVLAALRDDRVLSEELASLQRINSLIALAYDSVPTPGKHITKPGLRLPPLRFAAAILLIVLGGISGWLFHSPSQSTADLPFTSLSQLNIQDPPDNKILIHINSMDGKRITKVLDDTERLLRNARKNGKPLQLEVVANASGLGMLRKGSPYAQRIQQIAEDNNNVSFLACGFAMENARLKEGHNIHLIPQAHKVDAALEEILRRLKAGWLYVRG